MLSSSTPDLRECLGTSSPVLPEGPSSPLHRGPDKRLHGETKEIVPRPGSAPATKFSDCDSAFEEIGDFESSDNLGDIFSVLSIEDDVQLAERKDSLMPSEIPRAKPSPQRPSETPASLLQCVIPSIAEVSGEDSDSSNQSNRLPNTGSPTTRDNHVAQRNALNSAVDFNPILIQNLRAPLVSITGSDDTTTSDDDSEAELARFAFPIVNRNIAQTRRRHSLAASTPDQITRMLLSHRRGSASGLPIQHGDPSRTTVSSNARKPMIKQRSADGEVIRSIHQTLQAVHTAQTYQGPTGRRGSATRSKSPFRLVTAREESAKFCTVSSQDVPHRGTSPSPGSRSYSSGENLSPRPMSPRPRSPCRHRPLSPRDEIEQILNNRSRSPSPRNLSASSSITRTLSHSDRSRSPASRTPTSGCDQQGLIATTSRSRLRSRSPRPRHEHPGSNIRPSYNFQRDDSPGVELGTDPQKTKTVSKTLAVQEGTLRHGRSRSPASHSLKATDRRPPSPQPHHVRSHKPSQERRLSTRRSSKPDVSSSCEELASKVLTTHPRRPSYNRSTSRDESDDSTANSDRIMPDRRKRRGSRGKILPLGDQRGPLPTSSLLSVRMQSRRSSISISHPTKEDGPLSPSERAEIHSKLTKRGRRRSSWAGAGDPFSMPSMSALSLLRESGSCAEDEEQEKNKDPHILTLHFITDPGQSHPLQLTLRPLIESIVPKLKLFNFVERSESASRDPGGSIHADHRDKATSLVPTLGVVLLLQEAFGMERILEAQKYLRSEPWELHHRGKVGSNNVPYPTNNQDFYAHQTRDDAALWAVRQVHFGKDRLRFQLFVSDDMWTDTINFYSLLLSRPTHIKKEDFCYFLVFCSQGLNLEVQLALKKLPPGFKPQFLDSTILQFKVGDMCQLVPLLPRVCIPISDKRWQTADPDGNKVLLFCEAGPTTSSPASESPPPLPTTEPAPPTASCKERVVATSCDSSDHKSQERSGHFEEWFHELVSAV